MLVTIIKIILALLLCVYLFLKNKLTISGTLFAIANIIILQFIGGDIWLNIFLINAVLSMFVPKLFTKDNKAKKPPRDWKDMSAITLNSIVCITINKLSNYNTLISFYSALSFILADIFSSEIRLPFWKSKARLISKGFKVVEHGVSGAVSISGFFFSFVGAAILGLHYFFFADSNLFSCIVIIFTGFFVCFLESIFNDYKNLFRHTVNNEITNGMFVIISIIIPLISQIITK